MFFLISQRLLPQTSRFLWKLGAAVGGGLAIMYVGSLFRAVTIKIVYVGVVLLAFGIVAWFWGLARVERDYLIEIGMRKPITVQQG